MQFIEDAAEEGISDDESIEIQKNTQDTQLINEQIRKKKVRIKQLFEKIKEYDDERIISEDDYDEEEEDEENYLYPTQNDPKFWKILVRKEFYKHENEVVLELTLRRRQFKIDEIQSSVTAIIFKNQGELIVEALFERDVIMLIKNCYMVLQFRQQLESYEVASLFKKYDKNILVQVGQFARIKQHKLYGGDLCKVLAIKQKTMSANVKLIEREQLKNGQRGKKIGIKTKKQKITKELFNQQSQFYYEKDVKKEKKNARGDGFIVLTTTINNLQVDNLNLQEEELKYFYPDVNNLKDIIMQIHKQFYKINKNLQIGDQAVVQGLNKQVTVKQQYDDGDYEIELKQKNKTYKWKIQSHLLSKAYKKYQNVWIQKGPYKGFEGTILNLNDITATVHIWEGNLNVELHVNDLGSKKVIKNENLLTKIKIYDLVRFQDSHFGCVLNLVHDKAIVLNEHNDIQEVNTKNCIWISTQNNYAIIQDQQAIKNGDYIKIVYGHYGEHVGTVLHCYKDYIYILCKQKVILEKADNCRIFVKYTQQLKINENKNEMLGCKAQISNGIWKGYKGQVVKIRNNRCLIDLDAKNLRVQSNLSDLQLL